MRLSASVVRLAALLCMAPDASGAMAAATPTAFFEDASIIGVGKTITVSRVPVTNSAGVVTYYDVGIAFSVNAGGQIALTAAPTVVKSVSLITSNFFAGEYVSLASGPISLSGPGVGPGGQTAWSIAATTTVCTQPASATWYTGTIAANPEAARLQKAGVTLTQYSYGIIGIGGCGPLWSQGGLIGAQQIQNTLTLVTFSSGGKDSPIPLAQMTFTLNP